MEEHPVITVSALFILLLFVSLFIPLPIQEQKSLTYEVRSLSLRSDGSAAKGSLPPLCVNVQHKGQTIHQACQTIQRGKHEARLKLDFSMRHWRSWAATPLPAAKLRTEVVLQSGASQGHELLVFRKEATCKEESCQGQLGVVLLKEQAQDSKWLKQLSTTEQRALLGDVLYHASNTSSLRDSQDPANKALLQELSKAALALQDAKVLDACSKRNEWKSWVILGVKGVKLVAEALARHEESKRTSSKQEVSLPSQQKAKKDKRQHTKRGLMAAFLKSQTKAYMCKQARASALQSYEWGRKILLAKVAGKPRPKRSLTQRLKRSVRSATKRLGRFLFSRFKKK